MCSGPSAGGGRNLSGNCAYGNPVIAVPWGFFVFNRWRRYDFNSCTGGKNGGRNYVVEVLWWKVIVNYLSLRHWECELVDG